ncbi:hypothetical protein diail_3413 [Diaporthe ilicicola]|nr:hypothetical protein diail_3413 [Diaporthe ilicicola]
MRAQTFALALAAAAILSAMTAANESLLYRNPLNSTSDVATWVAEGPVNVTAVEGALQLSGGGGIDDHFVFWAPEVFPDRIRVTWEFSPRNEPGLAIFFFAAESVGGGSIFDPGLAPRNGSYPQYHSSDIRTLHVSYFRRRWPEERAFLLSNLRKSPGFNLVAQGADPLPPVMDASGAFYRIAVIKDKSDNVFLEQRSLEDLKRNSLVSVFLPILEYYAGILILTSNRVGTLEKLNDPAIDVPDLRDYLKELQVEEMNGRQIWNAITTASQYTKWKNVTLTYTCLKDVIDVAGRFDKYLDQLHEGRTQDQLAEGEGVR